MNKLLRGTLEERFFAIVLLCTIPYYLLNLATILSYEDTSAVLVGIYTSLLLFSIGVLTFTRKKNISPIVINAFSLCILFAFTYYLPKSGGPTGGSGYVIQNIAVLMILMTKGFLRIFATIFITIVAFVLFTDLLSFSGQIIYTRLLSDYLVNLLFISIFMVFFKFNFDADRKELVLKNEELALLNEELNAQNYELEQTNKEIESIKNNLEREVAKRTEKLENENKKLLEYSFINAHLVRAPMANIIGIVEMNPEESKFKEIDKGIREMDDVVRKIARVLT